MDGPARGRLIEDMVRLRSAWGGEWMTRFGPARSGPRTGGADASPFARPAPARPREPPTWRCAPVLPPNNPNNRGEDDNRRTMPKCEGLDLALPSLPDPTRRALPTHRHTQ